MLLFQDGQLNKERIFQRIINENGIAEEDGSLYIDAKPQHLYPAILQFAQAVAKVSSMRVWRREVIHSLFFEQLSEVVFERLTKFRPMRDEHPLAGQDEYEVDYVFNHRPRPVYLFGVNGKQSCRLSVIAILKFQNEGLNFKGAVVLDDLRSLNPQDQTRLLSAADKTFPTLDDFRENGARFLERELAD